MVRTAAVSSPVVGLVVGRRVLIGGDGAGCAAGGVLAVALLLLPVQVMCVMCNKCKYKCKTGENKTTNGDGDLQTTAHIVVIIGAEDTQMS